MPERPITFDRFARIVLVAAVIVCLYLLLYRLEGALFPFCVAGLFAYLLHPLVALFQYRLRLKSRVVAISLTFLLMAGVLFGLYELIVPPLFEEVGKANDLIVHYLSGSERPESIPTALYLFIERNIDFSLLNRYLTEDNFMALGQTLLPKMRDMVNQSFTLLGMVASVLLMVLYTFFILLDYESLTEGWVKLIPAQRRERISGFVGDVKTSMNRYFRGQALIALIVGVLSAVGFLLIDLPMAIAMGLLVGLLTLVPYLKTIALVPTLLLTLLKAADTGMSFWWLTLLLLIVFAAVQVIEDLLLVPKIMGHITGLNPAIILLSLSIWGSLLGLTGIIIALPITSLLLTYYREYRLYKDGH
jgi:predicted PurR-regulated permease PerM